MDVLGATRRDPRRRDIQEVCRDPVIDMLGTYLVPERPWDDVTTTAADTVETACDKRTGVGVHAVPEGVGLEAGQGGVDTVVTTHAGVGANEEAQPQVVDVGDPHGTGGTDPHTVGVEAG
jgi:hypothetical protein